MTTLVMISSQNTSNSKWTQIAKNFTMPMELMAVETTGKIEKNKILPIWKTYIDDIQLF